MAKIDIAREIVNEFPDRGYDAEALIEKYTEKELLQLQKDLLKEQEQESATLDTNIKAVNAENALQSPESEELLSEEHKTALEVETTAAQNEGEPGKDLYKLADPTTHYAENGFTLMGDQEKALPDHPSAELIARIRSGFIVKAE